MIYNVKLDCFEGPIELLLDSVKKEEIDVCTFSITKIIEDFLQYLERQDILDLESIGIFLVLGATLLEIKSKVLLPSTEKVEEEDLTFQRDWEEILKEYEKYKEISLSFRNLEDNMSLIFTRKGEEFENDVEAPLKEVSIVELISYFKLILARFQERPIELKKEEITVEQKIQDILEKIQSREDGINFTEIFDGSESRIEIIVTFLAVLELIRMKKIRAYQSGAFSEIKIYYI